MGMGMIMDTSMDIARDIAKDITMFTTRDMPHMDKTPMDITKYTTMDMRTHKAVNLAIMSSSTNTTINCAVGDTAMPLERPMMISTLISISASQLKRNRTNYGQNLLRIAHVEAGLT
jgi:hypothetical protein